MVVKAKFEAIGITRNKEYHVLDIKQQDNMQYVQIILDDKTIDWRLMSNFTIISLEENNTKDFLSYQKCQQNLISYINGDDTIDIPNEFKKSLKSIRNAVSKQKSKKVKIETYIYTKCNCGYEFSIHKGDGYYSIPMEKRTNYCPNCGQKLNWGNKL